MLDPDRDLDQDVDYLRDVQYKDSSQLAKRANLHQTYGTAPRAGFDVFADLVDWPIGGGRVLDVGCGGGWLWEHIAAVAPDGLDLVLTDLSAGMVDEAVERAEATGRFASVTGQACDARELPFDDASFDVVVSTYALYHVPEPPTAVRQIARVVHDDGVVGIMTNGPGHLREIERICVEVFGEGARYAVNGTFSPIVASAALIESFGEVAWHRFDDTLRVTEPDDVLAFMTSTAPASEATPDEIDEMRRLIDRELVDGVFTVSKDTGTFICRRPNR